MLEGSRDVASRPQSPKRLLAALADGEEGIGRGTLSPRRRISNFDVLNIGRFRKESARLGLNEAPQTPKSYAIL
jgi:hypothetical protein